MSSLSHTPTSLGFQPVAKFTKRDTKRIAFLVYDNETSRNLFSQRKPATYMWIKKGTDIPLYIGQANYGMKVRAQQHEGGFYGTTNTRRKSEETGKETSGLAHARRIREIWECQDGAGELEVWMRPSGSINVFDGEVSLASVEEKRLIEIFDPPWNHTPKK